MRSVSKPIIIDNISDLLSINISDLSNLKVCRQGVIRYLALCTEDDPLRWLPRAVQVDSCHEYLVHRITCQILQDER